MNADRIAALIEILEANPEVQSMVAEAGVYGGELPAEIAQTMPVGAVVISFSGGTFNGGGSYQEFGDRRVDVLCYAETPYNADRLHEAVWTVLKQLRRQKAANTVVHSAIEEGGPISLRDPDTDWPYVFSSWQVMAAEVAVL